MYIFLFLQNNVIHDFIWPRLTVLYSNLSVALNGEINYKFVSLCLWLLVLL